MFSRRSGSACDLMGSHVRIAGSGCRSLSRPDFYLSFCTFCSCGPGGGRSDCGCCMAREPLSLSSECFTLRRERGYCAFCMLRLAGSRPGRRPTFLLHGKKLGEKTCPASSVPESFAKRIFRGNLRPQQTAVCDITRCAPRRSAQTDVASQSTKFGCPAAAKPPPFAASAGAGRRVAGLPTANTQRPARAVSACLKYCAELSFIAVASTFVSFNAAKP